MTKKFTYLVERLYRANLKMDRSETDEERQCARRWLRAWSSRLRHEFNCTNRPGATPPRQAHK